MTTRKIEKQVNLINYNSKEAKLIGKELYKYIADRNNLFTKKWTIGRIKKFKQEISTAYNAKLLDLQEEKKKAEEKVKENSEAIAA